MTEPFPDLEVGAVIPDDEEGLALRHVLAELAAQLDDRGDPRWSESSQAHEFAYDGAVADRQMWLGG